MELLKVAGIGVILLLIAGTFMPAAAAQSSGTTGKQAEPRLIVPDASIARISDNGKTAVYTVIFRNSETDVRYFRVVQNRTVFANGTEIGVILVQTQDSCGCDPRGSFGRESKYIKTGEDIRVHVAAEDLLATWNEGDYGHRKFAAMFAVITGLSPGESAVFCEELLPTTRIGYYISTQKDGSLDFSMTKEDVELVHHAINFDRYCLWISVNYTNYRTSICL